MSVVVLIPVVPLVFVVVAVDRLAVDEACSDAYERGPVQVRSPVAGTAVEAPAPPEPNGVEASLSQPAESQA